MGRRFLHMTLQGVERHMRLRGVRPPGVWRRSLGDIQSLREITDGWPHDRLWDRYPDRAVSRSWIAMLALVLVAAVAWVAVELMHTGEDPAPENSNPDIAQGFINGRHGQRRSDHAQRPAILDQRNRHVHHVDAEGEVAKFWPAER